MWHQNFEFHVKTERFRLTTLLRKNIYIAILHRDYKLDIDYILIALQNEVLEILS